MEREKFTPRSLYQPAPDRMRRTIRSFRIRNPTRRRSDFRKPLIWMTTKPSTGFSRRPLTWILCGRFRSPEVCLLLSKREQAELGSVVFGMGQGVVRQWEGMPPWSIRGRQSKGIWAEWYYEGDPKPKYDKGRQEERASRTWFENGQKIASRLQEQQKDGLSTSG